MLKELLLHEVADLHNAERQLTKAIPKMAEAANSPELREAFLTHLRQTEEQVKRLESVFTLLGSQPQGKPCKGMAGLIEEGQEVIKEGKEKDDIEADLALIGAAQRVEHYEISAYGTARTMAEHLGKDDIVNLLAQTLQEEEETDEILTSLAESFYAGMIEPAGSRSKR